MSEQPLEGVDGPIQEPEFEDDRDTGSREEEDHPDPEPPETQSDS